MVESIGFYHQINHKNKFPFGLFEKIQNYESSSH